MVLMAVMGVLLLVGIALTQRWNGTAYETCAPFDPYCFRFSAPLVEYFDRFWNAFS